MPVLKIPGSEATYTLLAFDKDGAERRDDTGGAGGPLSNRILAEAKQNAPTHVFLFSHGWKGDMPEATAQYNRWISAMWKLSSDRERMGQNFRPLFVGLHWPSLPFGDEEFGGASFGDVESGPSPADLVRLYMERLGLSEEGRAPLKRIIAAHVADAAATELPPQVVEDYRKIIALTGYGSGGLDGAPDADGEPFDPVERFESGNAAGGDSFGGGFSLGGILGPLRQASYWKMKNRARTIGEGGMHDVVGALMKAAPQTRFHLMGHSFGCIVVSSLIGGPKASHALPRPVDSVALIQGAVSLWSFADTLPGESGKGYFQPLLQRKAIRGPLITTQSIHDSAVGTLYPLASAASFAGASFGAGDLPRLGAIGKFGIQGLGSAEGRKMLESTKDYGFAPGGIYNLEASSFIATGGGMSGAHSDIDGPQVAHALWQAALV